MNRGRFRQLRHAVVVGVIASLLAAACGSSATSPAAETTGATSTPVGDTGRSLPDGERARASHDEPVLGGIMTTATPGSTYNTWLQHVITRFKAAVPGSDVKVTLLPADNDQLAAQVQAAFASKQVPDVMMLYAGAYTTVYQSGLLKLDDYVNDTPGFYDWSGCGTPRVNFDCQGGKGTILGIPWIPCSSCSGTARTSWPRRHHRPSDDLG